MFVSTTPDCANHHSFNYINPSSSDTIGARFADGMGETEMDPQSTGYLLYLWFSASGKEKAKAVVRKPAFLLGKLTGHE